MYSETMIIANLGNDAEMRYLPNGTPVVNFRAAVNKSWTGQDGQRQEKTTWYRVGYFGKSAEAVMPYLTKGKLVMVKGEMEESKPYQNKEGQWVSGLELKANSIKLLGGSGGGTSHATGDGSSHGSASEPITEDQIPF